MRMGTVHRLQWPMGASGRDRGPCRQGARLCSHATVALRLDQKPNVRPCRDMLAKQCGTAPLPPTGQLETALQAIMGAVVRVQEQCAKDSKELRRTAESMVNAVTQAAQAQMDALQAKMADDKDFSIHTRDLLWMDGNGERQLLLM